MAKAATVVTRITYVDEDDEDKLKSASVSTTYNASVKGELDIPSGTLVDIEFAIPFGSIAAAKCIWVKNKSGFDMTLKINGSAALQKLKDDGELLLTDPAVSATPITSLSLTTVGTVTPAGSIAYAVFGD